MMAGTGPMVPTPPPLADLTGVCFKDQIFLNFVGGNLTFSNVFDYFANSPFYDRNCTNEQLRMQGIHPLDMAQIVKVAGRKTTVEYVLHHAQEPHLFVLKKQIRESPEKATPVALYYVLDGSIYQAPTLLGVIGSRMARALHHVETAFKDCQKRLEKLDKDKTGGESQGSSEAIVEEKRVAAEKAVDWLEVLRVDSILASVFSKLQPVPPLTNPGTPLDTTQPPPGTPICPTGVVGEEATIKQENESTAVNQGSSKRLKV